MQDIRFIKRGAFLWGFGGGEQTEGEGGDGGDPKTLRWGVPE